MANEEKGFQKGRINWYPGHMAKTKRELKERMNLIDCIYEIIDARMPTSSKIKDIDDILRDKPRILVMTKKDLCDLNVTNKWVNNYKEKGYKVVMLDLTNNQDYKKLIDITKEMMKPIQEKRKQQGLKPKEIKVGVIGIPNVGKSTLINKLAGKHEISLNRTKFNAIYGTGIIEGEKVILIKPQTYMNNSGEAVKEFVNFYKEPLDNIIVIYDDMDTDIGSIRVRAKGGPGSHNGMKSIVNNLSCSGPSSFCNTYSILTLPCFCKSSCNFVL